MLTDATLRNLKPRDKGYKVSDRDGLYVYVLASGTISFRYNYAINGRQETLVLGRYGPGGLKLGEARELLAEAKKALAAGRSPARQKANIRERRKDENTFGQWAEEWLERYMMAESTRDMRRSVYERDLKKPYEKLKLDEITEEELRRLCDRIVARGAPATAVQAREIVMLVFRYARERGQKALNPADEIRPSSIARFQPRERSLTSEEVRLVFYYLEKVATSATLRLGVKLLLLTMLRKSEMAEGMWTEVNFTDRVWTIPASRMKRRNPHNVYLAEQALDILIALRTCAGASPYVFPARYDGDQPISNATLNRVTTAVLEEARKDGVPLAHFTPHDFRRTASTTLHEAGFQSDWIEKCLAHEQRGVRAVYNKAEYADQRRHMMQAWANLIDNWTGRSL
ncbi:site-specific integrase [Herbaspirillum sp. SJZ107]|uniref:tyrosine-type recombinase/integrase n=1 Tax=Herbaspirillum sp. SJZ107 TaxID=2572881 RepID=UPI0011521B69|nr:site-specific integrase [Herbaspirillum sp. SJZ107]TQK03395.1 integrase [Herbaspirillum sp. SJZ107]